MCVHVVRQEVNPFTFKQFTTIVHDVAGKYTYSQFTKTIKLKTDNENSDDVNDVRPKDNSNAFYYCTNIVTD